MSESMIIDPKLKHMPWDPIELALATRGRSLTDRAIFRELLNIRWEHFGIPSNLTTSPGTK
jgi:hypothetical protein